jgi:hypothetical protein
MIPIPFGATCESTTTIDLACAEGALDAVAKLMPAPCEMRKQHEEEDEY